ncbi:24520_t:CDS:2, partial [Gigaspora rosea]
PITICIGRLEAQNATIADCYINILKLAAAIYQLPKVNPFKSQITKIYNNQYKELNHKAYLLCYYLYPLYRYGLKEQTFHIASLIASIYWKALRHNEAECIELLVEFHKFICNEKTYKAKFDSQKEFSLTW